ncbi:hypothetical protein DM01DRAFT_1408510 [Hesseltinella vesiculosa]|uniref:Up-regulated during septation protein 1 domain-containing protein n=1 Tax=Hesseltinella vesiculosa TaxID=101127 RepID=A0A1X2GEU4_9FUNG|nr:hypothetical protein DM01DRAFT_1408510 [Hesseltinella vesiculosa]
MSRMSNDDDRPTGLKFTRNYYGYQRDQPSSHDKQQGSMYSSYSSSRYGDNNPSIHSRPSIDSIDRPILPISRDRDHSPGSGMLSPTLPTRSPQRVRDSHTSTQMGNDLYDSRYSAYSTPSTYSKKDPLDPAPARPRQSEARVSLTKQIDHLWRDNVHVDHDIPSDYDDEPKDLLQQLAISQAVIEATEYKVLASDELEMLQKEYDQVKHQSTAAASQLALELKMQNTSVSLAYLVDTRHNYSALKQQQQIRALGQNMASMVADYQQLKNREIRLYQQLLEHKAGLLGKGIQQQHQSRRPSAASHSNDRHVDESPVQDTREPSSTTGNKLKESEERSEAKIQELMATVTSRDNALSTKDQELTAKDTEIEQLIKQQQEQQSSMVHLLNQLNSLYQRFAVVDDGALESSASVVSVNEKDPFSLVSYMDKTLGGQKTKIHHLEREIESIHEKHRLEALADKKVEIQLRATQERKEAAEARCEELTKEIEQLKNNHNSLSDLDRLKADLDNLSFNESSAHLNQVGELESQLHQAEEHRQRLERELIEARSVATDLEVEVSKSKTELSSAKQREVGHNLELQQYKDDLYALQNEKKKWDRMMKRQTVMQLMDDQGGMSIKDKYEQQLEEQAQEYMAQLKEQKVFLDKVSKDKDTMQVERDQLQATCNDLEELIRGKTRILDARDIHISELESQVQELKLQSRGRAGAASGAVDAAVLQELQDAFTRKEIAWMEQSANMETNFEGILKEFDRLTGSAVEFENERMTYERRIEDLEQRLNLMDEELNQARIDRLGFEGGDTPTTTSLRKEFRRMVNDLKQEHQRLLERETEETKRVEKQLKDLKHEIAMSNYEKVNKSVQTPFDREFF